MRRKTLAKAYYIVPQNWVIDCCKMYKIPGEVIKFIEHTMENCRVELKVGGKSLTEVKIQRGISRRQSYNHNYL